MRNSLAAPWCSTSFLCVPNRGLFQSPQNACADSPSSRLPALRCFFNVKICSVVFPFGLKPACSFLSFLSIPFLIRSSSTLWNILLMMGSNFHTQFSPPPFTAIFLVMLFGPFSYSILIGLFCYFLQFHILSSLGNFRCSCCPRQGPYVQKTDGDLFLGGYHGAYRP